MRQERQEARGHEPRDPAHGPAGTGVPTAAEAALRWAESSGRATPQVSPALTQKFDCRLLPACAGTSQLPWQPRPRTPRPDLGKSRESSRFLSGGGLPRWSKSRVAARGVVLPSVRAASPGRTRGSRGSPDTAVPVAPVLGRRRA